MKICIKGFSESLLTNPVSEFENSKWRIQYGDYFRLEWRFFEEFTVRHLGF